ncbi:SRPBCC family protein [Chitinophaga silvatica]|nr:hypothetical protein [Chitinophaga silvatica]
MSIAFLVGVPVGIGVLTVYLSPLHLVEKPYYKILMPWIPILLFCLITLLFFIEGWGCWIMILPVFLLFASIGGYIGGKLKLRKKKREEDIFVSLIVLLPLIISPLEQWIGSIPGTYKAYTYIDINAPADKIWSNVTRVGEIPESKNKASITKFLQFPRPIKAELNYEGVGASRSAIFSGGLVFHETVLEYEHQHKMTFSIKAYPYEIPSTTLDNHIVIGGQFFDVLNGTYELEKLSEATYRLHLYSYFKLNTTFNFYASYWARWIMKDIQNNILQIEKERAENMVQK